MEKVLWFLNGTNCRQACISSGSYIISEIKAFASHIFDIGNICESKY